ncbi:MAG: aminopeptidase P family protein [Rhodospirillaceae bacterium]|jgi:Xaa-Pro dipeptidase|nr:aminopeptidase P family protein [Rhodospirillaceae bacterium]MBT5242750.1 aminopeptidase P family protein [Rhodospirillaceae bacterium]MBT5561563.1 aminopeptidase P family protein [Rhodospirillaceae bacterium]MBT6241839.1 aminopeptidase P family protein [Rhodospirillaceae bacterium]MBT7138640.1 aminopeptidase P family protein [Rhodospirillaceae bacterium]
MPINAADAVYNKGAPRQHGAMEFSDCPVDLDSVRLYRLGRIRDELRKKDCGGALLFDQVNTRYATDSTNMQIWCSHYETRCVFIATDGPVVLFDYSNLPHLAAELPTIDEYRVMPSFYYFAAAEYGHERAREFGNQIADLMKQHGAGNKRLAVDRLSHMGTDAIRSHGIELFDGLEITEQARMIKSADELVLMQRAIEVCETGMKAMHDAMVPGITENALWAKLHETNIALGGEWIETRLLSSGPRTNPWFRECSMRPIEPGDMVSFDTDLVGPYGYCADISRSWRCGDGKPDDEQRRLYANAHEQLHHDMALLKPGMSFREVIENAWPIPDEFMSNRYTCLLHGVGLADEYPSLKHRIDFEKKGYDGYLEEGMTVCVESMIASEGGREGVKLEEQVLITKDGAKAMSSYRFEEDWL